MIKLLTLTFLLNIMMNSCTSQKNVDLIVVNAHVYLVDKAFSVAESFAVDNGKVIATGRTEELLSHYRSDNVVDMEGRYVYPGFNDAHCHFYGYGLNLIRYADLRGTTSPGEIYTILQKHNEHHRGEWVLGRSWDQNDWEDSGFPDRKQLDKLFPEVPVYLLRVDGHAAWVNSKALEIAGITADTEVSGGKIEVRNGEPTGILTDNAMLLVEKHIPQVTPAEQHEALLIAAKNCMESGLTSVTDCGVDLSVIAAIKKLQGEENLGIRINAMLNPTEENIRQFVGNGPSGDENLLINTIKLFADGALGSRGALMLEDYSDDPGNKGIQVIDTDFFEKICSLAYKYNYIVATHAIGDGANRLVLDTYSKFLKGKNDRRWRIEHAQVISSEDFERFGALSVIPSIQATHCTSDMGWVEERLGNERLKGAYAYKTLLEQNGWLPNGTDFPVEEINPLYTFYASVFRSNLNNEPEGSWQPEEGLTREQALRSMTVWPAKASFEEHLKGSLETGRLADFVVLEVDLMTAGAEEIAAAKVHSTWIGGKKVIGRE